MKISESLIKNDVKLTEIQWFEWGKEEDFDRGQNIPSHKPL
jgi:hypothetical protein